jgi:hypothetical protein
VVGLTACACAVGARKKQWKGDAGKHGWYVFGFEERGRGEGYLDSLSLQPCTAEEAPMVWEVEI